MLSRRPRVKRVGAACVLAVSVAAIGGTAAGTAAGRGVNLGAHIAAKRGIHSGRCTIYVAPRSSRHGAGRTARRPTTLGWAVGHARPGGVVCLERGTYRTTGNITLSRSGRPGHPITFTGYHSRPLLVYTGRSAHSGGVLQTTMCRPWCASHDLVIKHLRINGRDRMESGVFEQLGARDVAVVDCVIAYTGASGVALNAIDHAFVANNLIYHTGYGLGYSSGINLWYGGDNPTYGGSSAASDGAPGFHNYIVGNIVAGSYDNSSHHSEGHGINVDGAGSIPPALIANNVVYENGGAGIVVARNRGDIWVVNNTAYADALDLGGYTSEFMAVFVRDVHFVNNVAFGRSGRAFTYNNTDSSIVWARNLAYRGRTTGLSKAVTANRRFYRYANPRFVRLPRVPSGPRPWERAVPPWHLGRAFRLRLHSPAIGAGIRPTQLRGITNEMAAGLRLIGLP